MLTIVPNYIHDEINSKLDAALLDVPDAAKDRDALYSQLVSFVMEYGYIPEFSLAKEAGER